MTIGKKEENYEDSLDEKETEEKQKAKGPQESALSLAFTVK